MNILTESMQGLSCDDRCASMKFPTHISIITIYMYLLAESHGHFYYLRQCNRLTILRVFQMSGWIGKTSHKNQWQPTL